jgi:hypothetical protein
MAPQAISARTPARMAVHSFSTAAASSAVPPAHNRRLRLGEIRLRPGEPGALGRNATLATPAKLLAHVLDDAPDALFEPVLIRAGLLDHAALDENS